MGKYAGCSFVITKGNSALQMKEKKDPYYNPDKLTWDGVDTEMWKDINKKYIEKDK